ncbi:MAG: ribonuclease HII, partial [Candidatus Korarchaeum sp.]|nr:ribonuclease HII [Candidatus Korarchaeum sp.]MDW8034847.1 ribonuclease HII [Candidatus Korarchaeum sp.]
LSPSAGVDEAGRGPVIGPMVIASVVLSRGAAKRLREAGITDSKRLRAAKREELLPIIVENADSYAIKVVEPRRVDEAVSKSMLNLLEAEVMGELLRELKPVYAIVDSPMRNCRKFAELVRRFSGSGVRIKAENYADLRYTQVAAASIVAKVERDRRMRELSVLTGMDLGSGYPHDPRTREAIIRILRGESFPADQVRWKWATVQRILADMRRSDLTRFLD